MSHSSHRGLPTPPQKSPLAAFGLAPALRAPQPVPPSVDGHCELCGFPLDAGEAKFHRRRHGFDCRAAFYALARQEGPFLLPRLIQIRRLRPHKRGQAVPGLANTARREIEAHIDDLIRRMRAASERLPAPDAGTGR